MVQGDPENIDAQYRTEYSIKALEDAGMETEELLLQRGDWDQARGQQITQDALTDAVQNIVDGNFTGTVFNDYFGQAQGAANLAVQFLKGEDVEPVNMVDYVKVTSENAAEILEMIK